MAAEARPADSNHRSPTSASVSGRNGTFDTVSGAIVTLRALACDGRRDVAYQATTADFRL
jgi:hypothetical protein